MARFLVHALLLCLLAPSTLASSLSRRHMQAQVQQKVTGKAIVISYEQDGQPDKQLLAVRTPTGRRVQIAFRSEKQLKGIRTGMDIEVSGQWQQTGAAGEMQVAAAGGSAAAPSGSFQAATIRASGAAFAAPKLTAVGAGGSAGADMVASASSDSTVRAATVVRSSNQPVATSVNTLVVPIAGMVKAGQACPGTQLPKFTVDQVKRAVFEELNPTGHTLGSTFNRCSYNKSRLTMANSLVAPLVQLPCSGNTYGVDWTFSKCDFDDFNGYADAADEWLKARSVDISKYKYRVYLIPPSTCGFVGLGYMGCDDVWACRSWLSADIWTTPQAMAHEIGHNMFMAHAGSYLSDGTFDQYLDWSCTMGFCCGNRCPNTPHAWQLGWISVQQLDGSSLRLGQTVTSILASQSLSANSGLRIVPSWTSGTDPIFVGYRTKARGDAALGANIAGKVHLYTSAITNTFDGQPTAWRAALSSAGESWQDPTTGLVVRLKGLTATSATVSVCRKGGAETAATCAAGIDNDCNGLAGPRDPACFKLTKWVRRTYRGLLLTRTAAAALP